MMSNRLLSLAVLLELLVNTCVAVENGLARTPAMGWVSTFSIGDGSLVSELFGLTLLRTIGTVLGVRCQNLYCSRLPPSWLRLDSVIWVINMSCSTIVGREAEMKIATF